MNKPTNEELSRLYGIKLSQSPTSKVDGLRQRAAALEQQHTNMVDNNEVPSLHHVMERARTKEDLHQAVNEAKDQPTASLSDYTGESDGDDQPLSLEPNSAHDQSALNQWLIQRKDAGLGAPSAKELRAWAKSGSNDPQNNIVPGLSKSASAKLPQSVINLSKAVGGKLMFSASEWRCTTGYPEEK
jgi:hypothetical protein